MVDTLGTLRPLPRGGFIKDENNSTTTPLDASTTFTGTKTDVSAYDRIRVTMKMSPNVVPDGDGSTAEGSMYVEYKEQFVEEQRKHAGSERVFLLKGKVEVLEEIREMYD